MTGTIQELTYSRENKCIHRWNFRDVELLCGKSTKAGKNDKSYQLWPKGEFAIGWRRRQKPHHPKKIGLKSHFSNSFVLLVTPVMQHTYSVSILLHLSLCTDQIKCPTDENPWNLIYKLKCKLLPPRQIKYTVDFDSELKIGEVRYDNMI